MMIAPINHPAPQAATRNRSDCRWLVGGSLAIWIVVSWWSVPALAQNDAWPVPARSADMFGFPYPPPSPDEPGVTLTRRYMLDGVPELNFRLRSTDELWLVSSRNMHRIGGPPDQLICKRACGDTWEQLPLSELIAAQSRDTSLRNTIFVHGYRTDAFWARRRGKQFYQATIGNVAEAPPTRFVIWAWPSGSSESHHPFQDFRQKQQRTRIDGYWLGHYLSHVPAHADPVLVTYSLGAQVAVTAMTDLQAAGTGRSFRMLCVAPVTRCEWPCDSNELSVAAGSIRQLTLIRNKSDIALRVFDRLCRMTVPQKTCPGIDLLAQQIPEVRQFDVADEKGCEHNLVDYARLPLVCRELERLSRAPVSQLAVRPRSSRPGKSR